MSIYQKTRNGVAMGPFQFIHEVNGKRNIGSTGTEDRAKAEIRDARERAKFRKAVELRQEVEAEARAQMEAMSSSPIYTLGELLPAYSAYVEAMGHKTASRMARAAARVVELMGPDTEITSIDNLMIEKLLIKAKNLTRGKKKNDKDPLKNNTISNDIIYRLKYMLRYAVKIQYCVIPRKIDWSELAPRQDNVRTHWLSFTQSDALDAVLLEFFPDFYAIDKFARASALRLDNLVNLDWSEVDWEKREINVIAKGGFHHVVPITQEIEDLLRPLIGHHKDRVFTVRAKVTRKVRGEQREAGKRYPLGREMYKIVSRQAFRLAGIQKGYTIHCHRHTAATWLYAATPSLIAVQLLLGHRDIRMTLRYTKLDLRALRAAMEAVVVERLKEQATMQAQAVMSREMEPTLH